MSYFRPILAALLATQFAVGAEQGTIIELSDDEVAAVAEQTEAALPIALAEGLEARLWAPTALMGDPIGIDVDDQGQVWVSVTTRRRTAKFDIRNHENWMMDSLSWTSVPEREAFLRREFAPERSEFNAWLGDANDDGSYDWRDLTVAQEKIYRLEDRSGDGRADLAQVFVSRFNEVASDVAGTVLHHQGDVFAGVAPDLWRLRDEDGDGSADLAETLSSGYSVHIGFGGHGMSGLRVGPDGRIYWAIGDVGLNVVDQDGRRWQYPHEGAIMRAELDGSGFEVYAAGQRNVHEFDFDAYGNLIGVDNDGDHAGETERLVYIINGADSGWRINWQFGKYTDPKNNGYKVWMDEGYFKPRFEDQAAHILPPLAPYRTGPAGLVYNPGLALGPRWKDSFLVAEFTGEPARSAIHAYWLRPSGASFELAKERKLVEGILGVGIDFGPDGALYVADWVEGWAPNALGRIWRIDEPDGAKAPQRRELAELLASSLVGRTDLELRELMGAEDMRARLKAQFELVHRGATETLQEAIRPGAPQMVRIHGIWGLSQLARRQGAAAEPLLPLLGDEDAEIRAQAARSLGDTRYAPAADDLMALLADASPRVRLMAAEALGRIGHQGAFDAIVAMLVENDDQDVYLRHAGAIALARIGDGDALGELSRHPSRAARIAAVVALKRLEHPQVARFLRDEDEYVVTNAARAIGDDDQIQEALPELAGALEESRFGNEPLIRRAINANVYGGAYEDARRMAQYALKKEAQETLRLEALAALSVWEEPSYFDRVTGRYRGPVETDAQGGRQALVEVLPALMEVESAQTRGAALAAAGGLRAKEAIPLLADALRNDPADSVRLEALRALAAIGYDRLSDSVFQALSDSSSSIRQAALGMIGDMDLPAEEEVSLLLAALNEGGVEVGQAALRALGQLESPAARTAMATLLERLESRELEEWLQLDLIEAIEASRDPALQARVEAYRQGKRQDDWLELYRETLHGGNAARGRRVFFEGAAAACIRCHAIEGQGGDVGPELGRIAETLSREQLLESLVAPSERIAPGYGVVSVTTRYGRSVAGILRQESADTLLISPGGEEAITVRKADVVEQINAPSSMPPMGELLTRSQIRDLVAFLSSLGSADD